MPNTYKIIDTNTIGHPLIDGVPFNKFDAGEELLFQINLFFPNIMTFEVVSYRDGQGGMKEKLFRCHFTMEGASQRPFYIYAFEIESGGRKIPSEHRIQFRDYEKWTPPLNIEHVLTSFCESQDLSYKECYVVGISKPNKDSHDVIFCSVHPLNIITPTSLNIENQASSPKSIQVDVTTIQRAYNKSIGIQNKGTDFHIIAYKPQLFLWYMANRDNLHLGDINNALQTIKSAHVESFKVLDSLGYPKQQIFYGAPGTGKSNEIKKITKGESVIRTTFHPDSDYSTFVGCYKPTMAEEETQVVPVVVNNGISLDQNNGTYKEKRITYKFVMQTFLKAYLGAWKKFADAVDDKVVSQFLVIEEINRGNCAQIFGDLFQLLDRSDNGFSEYPIEADIDLQQEIERAFKGHKDYNLNNAISVEGAVKDYTSNYNSTLSEDIQSGRILLLPPNLYIWATMNTSDQSLFPIDSAFKRRWEWKYIKIKDENKNWKIDVEYSVTDTSTGSTTKEKYDWWKFLDKINGIISNMTSSADKQLGYFFCKARKKENDSDTEPTIITQETFVSKVIFYLWNDVFKDYGFEDATLFQYKEMIDGKEVTKDLTFPDFYDEEGEKVNEARLKGFLESVMNWKKTNEEHN